MVRLVELVMDNKDQFLKVTYSTNCVVENTSHLPFTNYYAPDQVPYQQLH